MTECIFLTPIVFDILISLKFLYHIIIFNCIIIFDSHAVCFKEFVEQYYTRVSFAAYLLDRRSPKMEYPLKLNFLNFALATISTPSPSICIQKSFVKAMLMHAFAVLPRERSTAPKKTIYIKTKSVIVAL